MASSHETVVLAHGLFGFRFLMRRLQRRLESHGFATRNWGYNSFIGAVERHAAKLRGLLEELESDAGVSRIHLVAHSMGGIVGWTTLQDGLPGKFGRFVLLTPPGRGSWAATWFGRVVRPVCPAVDQLSTRPDSFVNRLEPLDGVEIGTIAASWDFVVSADDSHVPGQCDHRVYPGMHHQVLFRADVAEAVARFLKTGAFGAGS